MGDIRCFLKLSVFDLLKRHISLVLPVAMTSDVGHGRDVKALMPGKEMKFGKGEE